ncbi:MAG: hypothetical protein H7230_02795 [Candidatus Parcubacteria bacterium]|nr:hypothetical protein [Candidatus Paceibacterota bacterium]
MSNQNPNKPAAANLSNQLALVNNQPHTTPAPVKQSQYKNLGQKIRKVLFLGLMIGFVIIVSGFGYVLASQGSDANSYQFVARFRTAAKSFQDLGEVGIGVASSKPETRAVDAEIDDSAIINANKAFYNPPIPDSPDNTKPEVIKSTSQASSSSSSEISSSSSQGEALIIEPAPKSSTTSISETVPQIPTNPTSAISSSIISTKPVGTQIFRSQ